MPPKSLLEETCVILQSVKLDYIAFYLKKFFSFNCKLCLKSNQFWPFGRGI